MGGKFYIYSNNKPQMKAFLLFLVSVTVLACKQNKKSKTNPSAISLNNQAISLVRYNDNPDSSKKAIAFLDSATAIDSNYFLAYQNKLGFYYRLNQLDKAIVAVNKMIQLSPSSHDLYLISGVLYSKTGDSMAAEKNFRRSLAITNAILDTMNSNNRNYEMLMMNKGFNLIMLNDSVKGNEVLQTLYNSQQDEGIKEMLLSAIGKTKEQLMEQIFTNK